MIERLRILALFAHPDDELSVGGALAHYAATGADITLICATRGEAATIYCADCATPETLAAVRTAELACCCRILGIDRLEWLDWPDGGVQQIPLDVAVAQLAPRIRQLRPHIIVTHPEHGNYPHPDHIGVHERALAAFHAAADAAYAAAGPVWQTPKFYVRAIPESAFDLIPGFREYRVNLGGQALPFVPDPDEQIDCSIDCAVTVAKRVEGWKCHRSQHNPQGTFSVMPEELQKKLFSVEHFRLFAHHLPAPLARHTAWEAGLSLGRHD